MQLMQIWTWTMNKAIKHLKDKNQNDNQRKHRLQMFSQVILIIFSKILKRKFNQAALRLRRRNLFGITTMILRKNRLEIFYILKLQNLLLRYHTWAQLFIHQQSKLRKCDSRNERIHLMIWTSREAKTTLILRIY